MEAPNLKLCGSDEVYYATSEPEIYNSATGFGKEFE
jgi:hypothetical protein